MVSLHQNLPFLIMIVPWILSQARHPPDPSLPWPPPFFAVDQPPVLAARVKVDQHLGVSSLGPTGDDAMGPHSNYKNLWQFPEGIKLSDHEKRKVVAEVVAIGV